MFRFIRIQLVVDCLTMYRSLNLGLIIGVTIELIVDYFHNQGFVCCIYMPLFKDQYIENLFNSLVFVQDS